MYKLENLSGERINEISKILPMPFLITNTISKIRDYGNISGQEKICICTSTPL